MNVIQRLNVEHASRIRYFLSKADTVPNERDRQKVVVQITQNWSSKIRNAHAFELPSLYIPDMMPSGPSSIEVRRPAPSTSTASATSTTWTAPPSPPRTCSSTPRPRCVQTINRTPEHLEQDGGRLRFTAVDA